jgi:cell division protein FtsW (lipid II flippase)
MRLLTDFLGYMLIISVLGLSLMLIFSPYRMERISAYLNPWGEFDEAACGSFAGISPALSCAVLQIGQRASR